MSRSAQLIRLRVVVVTAAALALIAIGTARAPRAAAIASPAVRPVEAAHGMVASSSPIASQVGVDIMKKGGNAVDAAVAVGFALAVTHPAAGNIGGGGFMVIRLANGRSTTVDFREVAPKAATRDMYLDKTGNPTDESRVGPLAVGVPGSIAGLALAEQEYGKLTLAEVMAPAIDLAANGFILKDHVEESLAHARPLFDTVPG
jgi:gamma-glutamyltranspeptidase/glutathione hydrolase